MMRENIRTVKRNWRKPQWWENILLYHIIKPIYNLLPNNGDYVLNEKWDNLVILDACRHDTFEEVTGAKVDYRISRGSSTGQFLVENFGETYCDDIIYVHVQPNLHKFCKGFYKMVDVVKLRNWDIRKPVHPELVYISAMINKRANPDKRIIAHFIQPHEPFLKDPHIKPKVWQSGYSAEEIYEAYKRNLKVVLPYALKLAEKLGGRTVITSDHGEAFGDRIGPVRVYGHPKYIRIPALTKVPWMVIET